MSLYHYTNPSSTHQYQEATERMKSCAGITMPAKRCTRCGKHKKVQGGTRIGNDFVCAGCK